ncbi:MAG: hypothetical protein QM571_07220 [Micrococcaceae bacterium]
MADEGQKIPYYRSVVLIDLTHKMDKDNLCQCMQCYRAWKQDYHLTKKVLDERQHNIDIGYPHDTPVHVKSNVAIIANYPADLYEVNGMMILAHRDCPGAKWFRK